MTESATKDELRHEIELLRLDINAMRRDTYARIIQLEKRLLIELGTMVALAIGLVAALVKLL